MAVVGDINSGDRLRRDMADSFAEPGEEAAGFREQPVDAVLQHNAVELAPKRAFADRSAALIEELRLHAISIWEPEELEVTVVLLIAIKIVQAIIQLLAHALVVHTSGGDHAQLHLDDNSQHSERHLRGFKDLGIIVGRAFQHLACRRHER